MHIEDKANIFGYFFPIELWIEYIYSLIVAASLTFLLLIGFSGSFSTICIYM